MIGKMKLDEVPTYQLCKKKKGNQPGEVEGKTWVAGNLLVDYLVHKSNVNSKSLIKSWWHALL